MGAGEGPVAPGELPPVHPRHPHVQQDQAGRRSKDERQRGDAVGHHGDGVALLGQRRRDDAADQAASSSTTSTGQTHPDESPPTSAPPSQRARTAPLVARSGPRFRRAQSAPQRERPTLAENLRGTSPRRRGLGRALGPGDMMPLWRVVVGTAPAQCGRCDGSITPAGEPVARHTVAHGVVAHPACVRAPARGCPRRGRRGSADARSTGGAGGRPAPRVRARGQGYLRGPW